MSAKRLFDITFAIVGIIVSVPLVLLIAGFIKIDSVGNVLFFQRRIGFKGSHFEMYKFRKFPHDWGNRGPGVTTSSDVRMTRVGSFLERTKLDELPQLWNILKGEMSFVGPRPESARYEDLYTGDLKQLMEFVPGIFGPNQVAYRNESEMYPANEDPDEFYRTTLFPEKARSDIAYFSNATFWSDLGWIAKGLAITISGSINWQRFRRRYATILALDLIAFSFAWILAHAIRFDGLNIAPKNLEVFTTGLWLIPIISFPIILLGGVYRHPLRFFSVSDLLRLLVVSSFAYIFSALILVGFFHRNTSFGVVLLGLILFLGCMVIPRLWRREKWLSTTAPKQKVERQVLIYGANQVGGALASFLQKGFDHFALVGFIDEDTELRGRFVNGFKVYGGWRDIDTISALNEFGEIWLTTELSPEKRQAIQNWAERNSVEIVSFNRIDEFVS